MQPESAKYLHDIGQRWLRNQLIHGYGVIDHRITWDIIDGKLPLFIEEVGQLLGSF
jgi:uncharacterized protein with HEPN domain